MSDSSGLEIACVESNGLIKTPQKIVIHTVSGKIESILHTAGGGKGIIWVCGARGGLDGPSFGIYRILSQKLVARGFSSLCLNYRLPGNLDECILDVLTGIDYLKGIGIDNIALVGHSFGGAVVIRAGIKSPLVRAVVGLSSQTYGAQSVAELSPKPLLLIHGERDRNLPAQCSQQIYRWAKEPKELIIYTGCGHFLRECHDELQNKLIEWLVTKASE